MKKLTILIMIILLLIPTKIDALYVNSECYILMDAKSGRLIIGQNINRQRLIASVTKIMTAVIAIESSKLDKMVKADESILKSYGTNIYIELNELMSLRDLVYGLMMKSGNDAAMLIASYLSGSEEEFAKLMNNKAKKLGMKNTIFRNPHGLDENTENYSTVYDIALLTRYAMRLPEYRKIVGTKRYIVKTNFKTYEWVNMNRLLFTYKYTTGGKNGYTERARRTLVTTATKDNLDLIAVTFNDNNQWVTHRELHEYGFNNYKNYKILSKTNFQVIGDYFYKDRLYIKEDFYYPLKESEKDKVLTKVKLVKLKDYHDNDEVGIIDVYLADEIIYTTNIYVDKKIMRLSMWTRLLNWLR